jgi:hypothetical protein
MSPEFWGCAAFVVTLAGIVGIERLVRHFLAPPVRKISRPPKPVDDRQAGLKWVWSDPAWIEVCDFCGGNCGQCGITGRVGNVPFNIEQMAAKVGLQRYQP